MELNGVRVNFLRAFCRNFTLTPFNGPRSACSGMRPPSSVVTKTLATPWIQAGSGPAAAHFLLLRQKKVSKEKATAKPLPSLRSGPQMSQRSAGWEDKLASLKHVFPQFPADRCLIWQRPNAEFKSNPNGNVKNNFNGNFKNNPQRQNQRQPQRQNQQPRPDYLSAFFCFSPRWTPSPYLLMIVFSDSHKETIS